MTAVNTHPIQIKGDETETKAEEVKVEAPAPAAAVKAKPAATKKVDPKAVAAAAKAKAAAVKAKTKAAEEETEEEEEPEEEVATGLEASEAWKKDMAKAPTNKADAEACQERLLSSVAKTGTAQIDTGREWMRLRQPLSTLGESEGEYLKSGLCMRKLKSGEVVVYNGLGMLGYRNQEEAALDMGLAAKSPKTGKVLLRKLSNCILAYKAHVTLIASGIDKGLNNDKLSGSLKTQLLQAGLKSVEESAGVIGQVVSGEVDSEEAAKLIAKAAKANSKRGVASIEKIGTSDLVRRVVAKLHADRDYLSRQTRFGDSAQWAEKALARKDVDEEQTAAIEAAKKEVADVLCEKLGLLGWDIKL